MQYLPNNHIDDWMQRAGRDPCPPRSTSYAQAQELQVDAFIASAYANATSDAGWTYDTRTYKFADSAVCKTAFASYFCLNPGILAARPLSSRSCALAAAPRTVNARGAPAAGPMSAAAALAAGLVLVAVTVALPLVTCWF